jgi:hypothetical protein
MIDTVKYKPIVEIKQIVYEFHDNEFDTTSGVYFIKLNKDKNYIFIRNNDSIGAVCHYLGKPASECVSIIRNDVKEEFLTQLNIFKRKING